MRVRISLCVRLAKQIEIAHGIWKLSHTHTHREREVCVLMYITVIQTKTNILAKWAGRLKKKKKNYELHFECILM